MTNFDGCRADVRKERQEAAQILPLPEVFRRISTEPVTRGLDPMTWKAAFLAAAAIAEEAHAGDQAITWPTTSGSPTDWTLA